MRAYIKFYSEREAADSIILISSISGTHTRREKKNKEQNKAAVAVAICLRGSVKQTSGIWYRRCSAAVVTNICVHHSNFDVICSFEDCTQERRKASVLVFVLALSAFFLVHRQKPKTTNYHFLYLVKTEREGEREKKRQQHFVETKAKDALRHNHNKQQHIECFLEDRFPTTAWNILCPKNFLALAFRYHYVFFVVWATALCLLSLITKQLKKTYYRFINITLHADTDTHTHIIQYKHKQTRATFLFHSLPSTYNRIFQSFIYIFEYNHLHFFSRSFFLWVTLWIWMSLDSYSFQVICFIAISSYN